MARRALAGSPRRRGGRSAQRLPSTIGRPTGRGRGVGDAEGVVQALGERATEDLPLDRSELDMRRMFVSTSEPVGQRIGDLRLLERFGAIVTRVRGGDVDRLARPDTVLEPATDPSPCVVPCGRSRWEGRVQGGAPGRGWPAGPPRRPASRGDRPPRVAKARRRPRPCARHGPRVGRADGRHGIRRPGGGGVLPFACPHPGRPAVRVDPVRRRALAPHPGRRGLLRDAVAHPARSSWASTSAAATRRSITSSRTAAGPVRRRRRHDRDVSGGRGPPRRARASPDQRAPRCAGHTSSTLVDT